MPDLLNSLNSLTKREKILAIATAGSLVVTLIFIAFFWLMSSYNANETTLRGILGQIEREDAKTRQAMAATRRKAWYSATSFSSDSDNAKNEYIAWLKKTLIDDIGVDLPKGVDPERSISISHEGVKVADQVSFAVAPLMTLKQLTQFMGKFYSVDALHRISSLKLTPDTDTVRRKKVRTGLLKTNFQIQILCLTSAGRRSEFGKHFRDLEVTADQAAKTIVRRDIFGPANSSPVVKAKTRSSYETGKDVSLTVTATDADEDDTLKLEMLKTGVEEAEFIAKANGRGGTLKIPGQPKGTYKFTLKVTDNGLPERSTEETITIRFKDKTVRAPKKKPKTVAFARETRITGNLRDREGNWQVLVKSQMDGKSWRLSVGESFEMDEKTWKVQEVGQGSATFNVGGEALTFSRGTPFDKPDERSPMPE